MLRYLIFVFALFVWTPQVGAQSLQTLLQEDSKKIERASRKTVGSVLDRLIVSGNPNLASFLEKWRNKEVYMRKEDRLFFFADKQDAKTFALIDIETGKTTATAGKRDIKQLKPNSGVRGVIAAALVQFQLSDPNDQRRIAALTAIERDPEASQLTALRASIDGEPRADLKVRKERLERLLTARFDKDNAARVKAIESFEDDVSVDVRAMLNTILTSQTKAAKTLDKNANVAKVLKVGEDIEREAAYELLVTANLAKAIPDIEARKKALIANISNGAVAGIPVADLADQAARDKAYNTLAEQKLVPALLTTKEQSAILASHVFYAAYQEPNKAVTDAASTALKDIENTVGFFSFLDLSLDGLSLASIYFLAAIGLAITFGVMGVINMAHGEFIMIGAYTGYVVQQYVPNYTASIIIALPLAFIIAAAAGVALERLVIRHLMHRPLETLLATFGISVALQQIAKNIFGTQARPLTSPAWLDGSWVVNDVISISYIRIAIFVLAVLFLFLLLFILNKTRLGLEVRAVTQNPRMASSMGINTDRVNMLTFGLGSGIAGIAGVAIGLFAQVTSELGSSYIVQSFMTVVVGGVGNIWGTLAGAGMIGSFQKAVEWLNPSNTLAAQTYMIIFIIIFIQFRPKGIIALKGRAAGD
ncbi:MAG: urea ABC transporter permease subunit UrtB [Hyphomicrobiales bacterium]